MTRISTVLVYNRRHRNRWVLYPAVAQAILSRSKATAIASLTLGHGRDSAIQHFDTGTL